MEGPSNAAQLQVRFLTKQEQYSIPDTTYALPSTVKTDDLNNLINELINEGREISKKKIEFDFLALGELVRLELGDHISQQGGSSEAVIEVEYVERLPAPQPQDCLLHDDWVSSIHMKDKWILSGCYDNTLHLWNHKGKHILTIPGHTESVKAVSFVSVDEDKAVFVSGSHDQTILLWSWSFEDNTIDSVSVCRGHTKSVDAVSVSPDTTRFVSGGWDSLLKVWSTDPCDSENSGESESKKSRTDGKKQSQTRTPIISIKGHREAVTGLCWIDNSIVSCSWDHTVRVWDPEVGACLTELATHKAMTAVHCCPSAKELIISSAADRHVRLLDSRTPEGVVIKCTYTSHTGWVQCVKWSPHDPNLFISGAYDKSVKLWDIRSPKAALYDLGGHEDKVLSCDWSQSGLIASGGADNTLRLFKIKPTSVPSGDSAAVRM